MNTQLRRQRILETLKKSDKPLTGTKLSNLFKVSRQIIVGDITILRATGNDIYATPRGYIIPDKKQNINTLATICCQHDNNNLQAELEIIIDNGGKLHDVIIEHPLYGEIRVNLFISTRREINLFIKKQHQTNAYPLMSMTDGIHYHTIEIPNEETLNIICEELKKANILVKE